MAKRFDDHFDRFEPATLSSSRGEDQASHTIQVVRVGLRDLDMQIRDSGDASHLGHLGHCFEGGDDLFEPMLICNRADEGAQWKG